MPIDWMQHNAAELAKVHPLLAYRVQQLLDALLSNGIPAYIVQSLRTWDQQAALYAQGRTTPGNIVTKARPGYSSHNFGLAVDIAPDNTAIDGLQLDWNASHPAWKTMLDTAPKFDLAEGAQFRTFPDNPHFYLRELNDTPTDAMRQAMQTGGLSAVWDLLSPQLPPIPTTTDITEASS